MTDRANPVKLLKLLEEITIDVEVEEWLAAQARPDEPLLWRPRGNRGVEVESLEQLLGLVRGLTMVRDWAVLERGGRHWGQTMRIEDGWIVEIDGIGTEEQFARRVYPIGSLGPAGGRTPSFDADGECAASHMDGESVSSREAALILWTWMRGALPSGYESRTLEEGAD